jgi:hypothetical protein
MTYAGDIMVVEISAVALLSVPEKAVASGTFH